MNVFGHGIVDYVVVFAFLLYAIYAAFTKTERILNILPAAVSFFFFIEIGPRLTADKLIPFVFLSAVLLRYGWAYFKVQNTPLNRWGLIYIFVLLYASLIGVYFMQQFQFLISSPHLNTRLVIQLISYFNIFLIFLIVRRECLHLGNTNRLLKAFVWTTTILVVYGFYQYFANQFGLPFRGIVYSEGVVNTASVKTIDNMMFRVNSFANEPKRLTYFMVLGILILLKFKTYFFSKIGRLLTWLLVVAHFIILWWTYSTSIYIVILVFLLGLAFYALFISFNKKLLGTLLFISLIGSLAYFYQKQKLDVLYEVRVDQQLERDDVREEVRGWEYMKKYPSFFVLGVGPGMYNFALAIEYPDGVSGLSFSGRYLKPINSALMIYMYDFGLLGTLVLIFPLILIVYFKRIAFNKFSVLVFFIYCTCIALDPTPTLFLLLGAFDAEERLRR